MSGEGEEDVLQRLHLYQFMYGAQFQWRLYDGGTKNFLIECSLYNLRIIREMREQSMLEAMRNSCSNLVTAHLEKWTRLSYIPEFDETTIISLMKHRTYSNDISVSVDTFEAPSRGELQQTLSNYGKNYKKLCERLISSLNNNMPCHVKTTPRGNIFHSEVSFGRISLRSTALSEYSSLRKLVGLVCRRLQLWPNLCESGETDVYAEVPGVFFLQYSGEMEDLFFSPLNMTRLFQQDLVEGLFCSLCSQTMLTEEQYVSHLISEKHRTARDQGNLVLESRQLHRSTYLQDPLSKLISSIPGDGDRLKVLAPKVLIYQPIDGRSNDVFYSDINGWRFSILSLIPYCSMECQVCSWRIPNICQNNMNQLIDHVSDKVHLENEQELVLMHKNLKIHLFSNEDGLYDTRMGAAQTAFRLLGTRTKKPSVGSDTIKPNSEESRSSGKQEQRFSDNSFMKPESGMKIDSNFNQPDGEVKRTVPRWKNERNMPCNKKDKLSDNSVKMEYPSKIHPRVSQYYVEHIGFNSVEPQQREVRSVEPQQRELNSIEPHQREVRNVEPQQREVRSVEPQQRELISVEPQQRELNSVEPHQREIRSVEPQQREVRSVEPQQREVRSVESQQSKYKSFTNSMDILLHDSVNRLSAASTSNQEKSKEDSAESVNPIVKLTSGPTIAPSPPLPEIPEKEEFTVIKSEPEIKPEYSEFGPLGYQTYLEQMQSFNDFLPVKTEDELIEYSRASDLVLPTFKAESDVEDNKNRILNKKPEVKFLNNECSVFHHQPRPSNEDTFSTKRLMVAQNICQSHVPSTLDKNEKNVEIKLIKECSAFMGEGLINAPTQPNSDTCIESPTLTFTQNQANDVDLTMYRLNSNEKSVDNPYQGKQFRAAVPAGIDKTQNVINIDNKGETHVDDDIPMGEKIIDQYFNMEKDIEYSNNTQVVSASENTRVCNRIDEGFEGDTSTGNEEEKLVSNMELDAGLTKRETLQDFEGVPSAAVEMSVSLSTLHQPVRSSTRIRNPVIRTIIEKKCSLSRPNVVPTKKHANTAKNTPVKRKALSGLEETEVRVKQPYRRSKRIKSMTVNYNEEEDQGRSSPVFKQVLVEHKMESKSLRSCRKRGLRKNESLTSSTFAQETSKNGTRSPAKEESVNCSQEGDPFLCQNIEGRTNYVQEDDCVLVSIDELLEEDEEVELEEEMNKPWTNFPFREGEIAKENQASQKEFHRDPDSSNAEDTENAKDDSKVEDLLVSSDDEDDLSEANPIPQDSFVWELRYTGRKKSKRVRIRDLREEDKILSRICIVTKACKGSRVTLSSLTGEDGELSGPYTVSLKFIHPFGRRQEDLKLLEVGEGAGWGGLISAQYTLVTDFNAINCSLQYMPFQSAFQYFSLDKEARAREVMEHREMESMVQTTKVVRPKRISKEQKKKKVDRFKDHPSAAIFDLAATLPDTWPLDWVSSPVEVARLKAVMTGQISSARHELFLERKQRIFSATSLSKLWTLANPVFQEVFPPLGGLMDLQVLQYLRARVFHEMQQQRDCDPRLRDLYEESQGIGETYVQTVLFPESFVHWIMQTKQIDLKSAEELYASVGTYISEEDRQSAKRVLGSSQSTFCT